MHSCLHCAVRHHSAEPATCRICLAEADNALGGKLISPCRCAGSMAHIHRRCLARVRAGPPRRNHCGVCTAQYQLPAEPPPPPPPLHYRLVKAAATPFRLLRRALAAAVRHPEQTFTVVVATAVVISAPFIIKWDLHEARRQEMHRREQEQRMQQHRMRQQQQRREQVDSTMFYGMWTCYLMMSRIGKQP